MSEKKTIHGVTDSFHDQGMIGIVFIVQDKEFIDPVTGMWSFDGMHILRTGDVLTVFTSSGPRQMEINMIKSPVGAYEAPDFCSTIEAWKEFRRFMEENNECTLVTSIDK